jgi:hypothetical protein
MARAHTSAGPAFAHRGRFWREPRFKSDIPHETSGEIRGGAQQMIQPTVPCHDPVAEQPFEFRLEGLRD